ncbi:hypothetical protein OJ996_20195 [Luteolibacter sp. GHJ8]|uniref:Uncharacterized protein n=2 Tax=Luteolibacter rhizosphaerae TaxID=2989719 RepID=A0ABT3G9P1_9BACT|nr:hypothetical protein [Luteolibacter rhizosphaerae]
MILMIRALSPIAALATLTLSSCNQAANFSGPDPLGPDHRPVVVRGNTAEAHLERHMHLDHYNEIEDAPPIIKVAGANASATW